MDLIKQILDGKIVIAQAEETLEEKATPIDAIPQERFTGDVLKGRGPRRAGFHLASSDILTRANFKKMMAVSKMIKNKEVDAAEP